MWTAAIALSFLAIPPLAGPADDAKAALQGAWSAQSMKADGRDAPAEAVEKMRFTFKGDDLLLRGNFKSDKEDTCTYTVDASKSPKQIDITMPNAPAPAPGIYEIKGDELRICLRHANAPGERPTEFVSTPGSKIVLIVLKKDKP